MFKKKDLNVLSDILKDTDNREMYLFNTSFKNLCLGQDQDTFQILVIAKQHEMDKIYSILEPYTNKGFSFSFSEETPDKLTYMYTIDSLHLSVNKLIHESNGDVQAIDNGIKHLIDKQLCLTEHGRFAIESHPQILFESIVVASQYGLTFEIESLKYLFNNRHRIKEVDKTWVYKLLKDIFYKSQKIRKGIALVNTLGISLELFGCNLHESSILNHLNKKDIFEYFTIIFSKFDPIDIDDLLVEKVGFKKADIKNVVNELRAINIIEDENDVTARKILSICGKDRMQNLIRLVKLLGYKELSKRIKEQKDSIVKKEELSISIKDIQACFRVEDEEAEKILDMALDKVIINPQLNKQTELLLSIHKDIESVNHG